MPTLQKDSQNLSSFQRKGFMMYHYRVMGLRSVTVLSCLLAFFAHASQPHHYGFTEIIHTKAELTEGYIGKVRNSLTAYYAHRYIAGHQKGEIECYKNETRNGVYSETPVDNSWFWWLQTAYTQQEQRKNSNNSTPSSTVPHPSSNPGAHTPTTYGAPCQTIKPS